MGAVDAQPLWQSGLLFPRIQGRRVDRVGVLRRHGLSHRHQYANEESSNGPFPMGVCVHMFYRHVCMRMGL